MTPWGSTLIAVAMLVGLALPVAAQSPAPKQPATTEPARPATQPPAAQAMQNPTDVQSFGDWTVRCFPVRAPAPCDIIQVAVSKEKKQKVSSVSFAYVPSRDNYAVQIVVPLGVSFATGLSLSAGDRRIEGLKYRRCQNDGCYVETGVSRTSIEALAAGGNKGSITVALYKINKPINLPLSLNGYGQALAKMKDLARAKAVTPSAVPPQPAPAPPPPGVQPAPQQ